MYDDVLTSELRSVRLASLASEAKCSLSLQRQGSRPAIPFTNVNSPNLNSAISYTLNHSGMGHSQCQLVSGCFLATFPAFSTTGLSLLNVRLLTSRRCKLLGLNQELFSQPEFFPQLFNIRLQRLRNFSLTWLITISGDNN